MNSVTHSSLHPVFRIWLYTLGVLSALIILWSLIILNEPSGIIFCGPLVLFSFFSLIGCRVSFAIILRLRLAYNHFVAALFATFAIIIYLNVLLPVMVVSALWDGSNIFLENLKPSFFVAAFPIAATWASLLCCLSEIRERYLS